MGSGFPWPSFLWPVSEECSPVLGLHPRQVVNSFPATKPQWQPRKIGFAVIWRGEQKAASLEMVVERFFFFSKELQRTCQEGRHLYENSWSPVLGCGNHSGDSEGGSDIVLDTSLTLNDKRGRLSKDFAAVHNTDPDRDPREQATQSFSRMDSLSLLSSHAWER